MNLLKIGLLLLVISIMAGTVSQVMAAAGLLPQTGQSVCYDATGKMIACAGTGQDAERQTGVRWTTPRFVVGTGAESQCVTDKLTGLMWSRNANAGAGDYTYWDRAITYANNLVLCGYDDWRLPNINELESLVNMDVEAPANWLNTQGFISVQAGRYWSSSSDAKNSQYYHWVVKFDTGSVSSFCIDYDNCSQFRNSIVSVWPVRGGQ